ncbi:MAG: response regulator transcription factor [Planctomycetes bacterium]|nr:response regulator transcription factor [Planctomycetota bacterium]
MTRIRIVLAEDHQVVRHGLRMLIDSHEDLEVVGEASNGIEALQKIDELNPDVLVFDISMPCMNGFELANQIRLEKPDVALLALTANEDRAYLNELMRLGVNGYLLKRSASSDLIEAIRTVYTGKKYLDQDVVSELLDCMFLQRGPKTPNTGAEPTEREQEVLRLIALGHTNKEVAKKLDISIKTVETHKSRAMTKLNLRNRAELIRYAASKHWIRNE